MVTVQWTAGGAGAVRLEPRSWSNRIRPLGTGRIRDRMVGFLDILSLPQSGPTGPVGRVTIRLPSTPMRPVIVGSRVQ